MIRLRDMIERGCGHPLLGPLVLLLLVLLLASVFLHVAAEGAEAAAEFGQLCVAIAAALGPLLLCRARLSILHQRAMEIPERGPPRIGTLSANGSAGTFAVPAAIPLRR